MLRVKRGQWFVLFAVIFSAVVITSSILLSEVSKHGTLVSTSIYDIPYYELRSVVTEMTRAFRCNDWDFKDENLSLINNTTYVYMLHGMHVNFTKLCVDENTNTLRMNFSLRKGGVVIYVDKNASRFVS